MFKTAKFNVYEWDISELQKKFLQVGNFELIV